MKIGVIGLGMVGEAVAFGLRRIGHEVVGWDIDPKKQSASFKDVLKTELIFVCVPTPTVDFKCNILAVELVITSLRNGRYEGLVVIKSTVPPGTTESFSGSGLRVAFCPEFLRERARFSDFVEDHDLCVIGTHSVSDSVLIQKAHGSLPKYFISMTPTEAELAKYFVNCFNAQRVVFANAFYDVCQHLGANYGAIKDAVCHRSGITSDYLTCNAQTREFGGSCLPKDTQAFATFVNQLGLMTHVFETIVEENDRVKNEMVMIGDLVRAARSA